MKRAWTVDSTGAACLSHKPRADHADAGSVNIWDMDEEDETVGSWDGDIEEHHTGSSIAQEILKRRTPISQASEVFFPPQLPQALLAIGARLEL